ncbi:MAG: diaminopimelate decarboxylase, partial [Allobaculum sp.]|nr:diaminopimelate decarboxylase [Allobaculum sp.]
MKENVFQGLTIQDGVAAISGVSVETLAKECGTPLYIYDEPALVAQMKAYTESFQSPDFQTRIVYATKAFNCKAMLRLCQANGLYCDSVSLGEIYTAKKADFDMSRIYFHGNNKTPLELEKAFEFGVGTIICDSLEEARRVCEVAKDYPFTTMRTLLRVNPQVDAHTHKYIQTATPDSKFGMPIVKVEDIDMAARLLNEVSNIDFAGFHAHIGSQLFETDPFLKEIDELTTFIEAFEARTQIKVKELDLGGGFGVWYTEEDTPKSVETVCQTLIEACQEAFKKHNLQIEIVSIEPGRSMVAEAGYLLYT